MWKALTVGRTTHSRPGGAAFEIVIAVGRSEARRHIGGPLWMGGLRSSIQPPLAGTIRRATYRKRNRLQPIPVEVVSQRSGTNDVVRMRAEKTRLKCEWLCSRKRKKLRGTRERQGCRKCRCSRVVHNDGGTQGSCWRTSSERDCVLAPVSLESLQVDLLSETG